MKENVLKTRDITLENIMHVGLCEFTTNLYFFFVIVCVYTPST